MSVFHDFKYDPKQSIKGGAHDWMYDHLGVFSWTTEFWSPQRQAGLEDYRFIEWIREHPVEDDLELLALGDEMLAGRGYVDWYAFDHPQLGKVELGGWDIVNYWFNVPFDRLEEEVAPHADWAHLPGADLTAARGALARRSSRWGRASFRCGSCSRTPAGCRRTSPTRRSSGRRCATIEVELDLPDGARLVAGEVKTEVGQLQGPRRQALDDLVGERRVDERPREARVGDRGAGGRRARD